MLMNCLVLQMTQSFLAVLYNKICVIFEYCMRNILIMVDGITFTFITYFICYFHFDLNQDQWNV